jgi:hypothetical protein
VLAAMTVVVAASFGLAAPGRPPTLVFLLAGQSNMAGLGLRRQLPAAYRTLPDNVSVWKDGAWVPLAPAGWGFGPEIAFGSVVGAALPQERIGIVKVARTGTGMDAWSSLHANSIYGTLINHTHAALRAAPEARVAAMLWMQGERDARLAESAAGYGAKLRAFVAAVRRDVQRPDLPFLCAQVDPPYAHAGAVRDAQAALPAQVPGTILVPTDGLGRYADKLHYDTAGQLELGRRFARVYLTLGAGPK